MSERKRAEEQVRAYTEELKDRGRRDPLTGLLTRPAFADELVARLDEQQPLAVVVVGLEGAASDSTAPFEAILERAARAAVAACRDGDVVGRVGSSEIALALLGLERVPAGAIVDRLRGALEELDVPGASFGVVTYPEDGSSVATLLEAARSELGMDVGYVARLTDTEQVFEAIEGDAASFGVQAGDALPLEATICRRMVNGEVECHVGDVPRTRPPATSRWWPRRVCGPYVACPCASPTAASTGRCAASATSRTRASASATCASCASSRRW